MNAALSLAFGAALTFASCATENTDTQAQAQIDSIVTSKTSIIENKLRHNNDSIINALAVARADSMMHKAPASPQKDSAAGIR